MHYEEKWVDGWLWRRASPHGQWEKVPEKQMIARMRHAKAGARPQTYDRAVRRRH